LLVGVTCFVAAVGADSTSAGAQPWVATPTPNATPNSNILEAAAASPASVWAVGRALHGDPNGSGDYLPLILRHTSSGWRVDPGAVLPSDTFLAFLSDVLTVKREVWAVGGIDISSPEGAPRHPLVEHWDGTQWRLAPYPVFIRGGELVSLSDVPTTGVIWAVGIGTTSTSSLRTRSAYWDGTAWHPVAMPPDPLPDSSELIGVEALAADDVWAVGTNGGGEHGSAPFPSVDPFAEHWDGHAWRIVNLPPSGCAGENSGPVMHTLTRVPGTRQLWAIGRCDDFTVLGHATSLAYHYVGGAWRHVALPSPYRYTDLRGVTATGPNDVWAVGWGGSSSIHPVVLHRDGTGWHSESLATLPSSASLSAATFTARRIWVVGSHPNRTVGDRTFAAYKPR
jgi:hypothetical protein